MVSIFVNGIIYAIDIMLFNMSSWLKKARTLSECNKLKSDDEGRKKNTNKGLVFIE